MLLTVAYKLFASQRGVIISDGAAKGSISLVGFDTSQNLLV